MIGAKVQLGFVSWGPWSVAGVFDRPVTQCPASLGRVSYIWRVVLKGWRRLCVRRALCLGPAGKFKSSFGFPLQVRVP